MNSATHGSSRAHLNSRRMSGALGAAARKPGGVRHSGWQAIGSRK